MKTKFLSILSLFAVLLLGSGACAVEANTLADSAWHVVSYNNGRQGIASVLAGTELTAFFAGDGTLYGASGCNDYTTSYTVSGARIAIRPAAATRKFCSQPDGVMQQETEFLNALETAATWRLNGDVLELRDANGTLAISLKSADTHGKTYLYRNEAGHEAVIEQQGEDAINMTFEGKTYLLSRVRAASGVKYEEVGRRGTYFWEKGGKAHVAVRGKEIPGEFALVRDVPTDDELYISINGETFRMKRVVSATGAKYEDVDDPTTAFWSKGRNATLLIRGVEYSKYVLIRNSPREDELFLTVDGENFRLTQVPAASGVKYECKEDPSTYFWSKGDSAVLVVRGKEYVGYDTEAKPTSAASGLPVNVEWKVERIADKPVVPGSVVTIKFGHNGKMSGKGSVNGYTAPFIATGDRILIRGAASTMMAGAPELMEQERLFFKMFEDIRRFELRSGKLVLVTADGREIVAGR